MLVCLSQISASVFSLERKHLPPSSPSRLCCFITRRPALCDKARLRPTVCNLEGFSSLPFDFLPLPADEYGRQPPNLVNAVVLTNSQTVYTSVACALACSSSVFISRSYNVIVLSVLYTPFASNIVSCSKPDRNHDQQTRSLPPTPADSPFAALQTV